MTPVILRYAGEIWAGSQDAKTRLCKIDPASGHRDGAFRRRSFLWLPLCLHLRDIIPQILSTIIPTCCASLQIRFWFPTRSLCIAHQLSKDHVKRSRSSGVVQPFSPPALPSSQKPLFTNYKLQIPKKIKKLKK